MKRPGISFMVRAKNEEANIGRALESISNITCPHEVVVVLNSCTDGTKSVVEAHAKENKNIRFSEYDVQLSKAGVETLITLADSKHSLVAFYNYAFSLCECEWVFKFDADFEMSQPLLDWINGDNMFRKHSPPTKIRLSAAWDGIKNSELYLSNCITGYSKWYFWEVTTMEGNELNRSDLIIHHHSPMSEVKPHWTEKPWFRDDGDMNRKYEKVIQLIGTEPIGMAKASNPQCDDAYRKVCMMSKWLEGFGIYFDR